MPSKKKTFQETVATLNSPLALLGAGMRLPSPVASPPWDRNTTYRLVTSASGQRIERLVDGVWEPAPLEAPKTVSVSKSRPRSVPPVSDDGRNAPSATRLFISHASADVALATRLTALLDAVLTIPQRTMRCTSVEGFRLEPGDDGPDELRANLESSKVVVGLLTPQSLSSSYVLMELGAAWAFESRVIPLVAGGAEFANIPGPIGVGIHASRAAHAGDMASVVESIASRCGMALRVGVDRQVSQIQDFVTFAGGYRGPLAEGVPAPKSGAMERDEPPDPAMLPEDRKARLRAWLFENTDGDFARGKPIEFAQIDRLAKVPVGTAKAMLHGVLDQEWEITANHGNYVELRHSFRVRSVRGRREWP